MTTGISLSVDLWVVSGEYRSVINWITDDEVEVAFKFYKDNSKYFRFYLYFTETTKTFLPSIIKSPKQRLETYYFCSVSYYYYYYYSSPFFLWHMNVSTADLRNYWTEFHVTWWSYIGPKVFSFVSLW